MTRRQADTDIHRRHVRNFLMAGGVCVVLWVAAVVAQLLQQTSWSLGCVLASIGVGMWGLLRQELLFRRYRCPTCGRRLRNSPRIPGAPIEYNCHDCDVIWETGFSEAVE